MKHKIPYGVHKAVVKRNTNGEGDNGVKIGRTNEGRGVEKLKGSTHPLWNTYPEIRKAQYIHADKEAMKLAKFIVEEIKLKKIMYFRDHLEESDTIYFEKFMLESVLEILQPSV